MRCRSARLLPWAHWVFAVYLIGFAGRLGRTCRFSLNLAADLSFFESSHRSGQRSFSSIWPIPS
jgi:hypothetical protein